MVSQKHKSMRGSADGHECCLHAFFSIGITLNCTCALYAALSALRRLAVGLTLGASSGLAEPPKPKFHKIGGTEHLSGIRGPNLGANGRINARLGADGGRLGGSKRIGSVGSHVRKYTPFF